MEAFPSVTRISSTPCFQNSWTSSVDLARIVEKVGTPVFVYSEKQLVRNVMRAKDAAKRAGLGDRVELYVPFFPNANPHLLKPLQSIDGVGLLVQIPSEYEILSQHGFKRFIVSPGHVSDDEISYWCRLNYPTFLSSFDEVMHWLSNSTSKVSVRIDSLSSEKPGIKLAQLETLAKLLKTHDRTLECFEVYCGSGNSLDAMLSIVDEVFKIYKKYFSTARSINFAGGHGFRYDHWQETTKHFDWKTYFDVFSRLIDHYQIPNDIRFLFEPARDVLADAGALLLSVKRDIVANPITNLIVTDGSRMLMPSAQYRSRQHNIVFLDKNFDEIVSAKSSNGLRCVIRGRTILRNDYVLPGAYWVPEAVGAQCYMLILDVGAYCATQHMEFLNVPPAPEVLIDHDNKMHLITARGPDSDKWRHLLPERVALEA